MSSNGQVCLLNDHDTPMAQLHKDEPASSSSRRLRQILRVIKVLGALPFDFSIGIDGNLIFTRSVKHSLWCFAACFFSVLIPAVAILAISIQYDLDVFGLTFSFWAKNGMRNTDFVVHIMLQICIVVSISKTIHGLTYNSEPLNYFCRIIHAMDILSRAERENLIKAGFKRMCVLSLFSIPVAAGCGLTWFCLLDTETPHLTYTVKIVMSVAFSWMYLALLFPLSPFAGNLLATYGMNCCAMAFSKYRKTLLSYEHNNKQVDQDSNNSTTPLLSNIISQGENMVELVDGLVRCSLNLIFEECTFSLVFAIITLYLGSTIFFLGDMVNLYFALALSLSDLLLAAIYVYRFIHTVHLGQTMENEVKETARVLYKKISIMMTELERFQLVRIREQLLELAVMRPRKMFNLNRAMSLSAVATITTYFIIFLQFKTSETGGMGQLGNRTAF